MTKIRSVSLLLLSFPLLRLYARWQIVELDSHKLLVGVGVAADSKNFGEYIEKNMKLYELNNDVKLSTHGAANFIRGEVSLVHCLKS